MDSSDATGTLNVEAIAELNSTESVLAAIPAGVAALVVVRGPNTGEVWPLTADVVEVGRSADSGLFLDDITVSRKHAIFKKSSQGWTLEDCGSLNGSYVNRELISAPKALHDEDEIQLGKFRFTFYGAR
jgi:pSer/pThr/pTyr-binding forkhead associated (FHA) protein